MISSKDYNLIQNLKNTDVETYNAVTALLNSQLDEFTFAAHEEKNLISFISSSYQFITSHHPEFKQMEFWNDINDSIHSLNKFMNRMTIYRHCHKEGHDKIHLDNLLYTLPDTVDSFLDSHSYISNNYTFNTCSDNIHIIGDYDAILTAFTEILINCCDISDKDIHIVTYTSYDKKYVTASISNYGNILDALSSNHKDTNANIPQQPHTLTDDELLHLCTPFFTTNPDSHSGLGLSMVYTVCQKNNGTLSISQSNGITTVSIKFPIYE